MTKKFGEKYEGYRRRTLFLALLPKTLNKAISWPMTKTIKGYPKNVRGIVAIIALYTITIITDIFLIILLAVSAAKLMSHYSSGKPK